jgi:DNA-binding transcriptional ArsR family regulator
MGTGREVRAKEQAEIHQIFSSSRRILIMWLLESREMCVSDIADKIGASLQSTSQHLRLMKDKGMLDSRRAGQTIFYRIKDDIHGNNCRKMLHAINPTQDKRK